MNPISRRHFVAAISAGAAVYTAMTPRRAIAEGTASTHTEDSTASAPHASFPVLMNPTEGEVSICWICVDSPESKQETVGWVEFGASPNKLDRVAYDTFGGFNNPEKTKSVRLTYLKTGQTYHYRVCARPKGQRDHPGWVGPTYTFTQLGAESDDVSFAVINDTHEHHDLVAQLIAKVGEDRPQFLCWNGDLMNAVSYESQIFKEIYHPSPEPYASSCPLVFVRGNHDCRGGKAWHLHRYIGKPKERRYYHHFRVGPVVFIVLDSCEDKIDARLWDGRAFEHEIMLQGLYLQELKNDPLITTAKKRVVFTHIPLWSKHQLGWSLNNQRDHWEKALLDLNTDLIISGHIHAWNYLPVGATPEEQTRAKPNHKYYPTTVTINQLVGGGPSEKSATIITGKWHDGQLRMRCRNLAGETLWNGEV
ncbi:hypothetical protein HED60_18115 [Planctomycetales bacterium ZRK34]|nr:hypothetical protein HED60_18115 [Planctomycetales bacterium ZRK34]